MKLDKKDATLNDFHDRFSKVVKSVGGSAKAAEIVGKSEPTINRYKKKGTEVPYDVVVQLGKASDLSFEWLIMGEGEPVVKKNGDVPEFSRRVIAQSVTAYKMFLDKQGHDISPENMAEAVLSVCDLAVKYGSVDLQVLEDITKIGKSL